MFAAVRDFFACRNVMEVDCPILSASASVDEYIDLITAKYLKKTCYLHSSPEYGMKRLLADGSGDIYQMSHVFRDGEQGSRHNPEFMMVEWYRCGFSYKEIIEETCDFIRVFVGNKKSVTITYDEAFQKYCNKKGEDLTYLFATEVEPSLDPNILTVIKDFPKEQCALAKIEGNIARRFEVFYGGMELANGYQELTDHQEQHQRLLESNKRRKIPLPIDNLFLQALEKGLPECCGVAVGFDRLMMLRHSVKDISDILTIKNIM